jgi:hypothetical protein
MAQQMCKQVYLILMSLLLIFTELLADPDAKGVYLKREHSLMKPYQGKTEKNPRFQDFLS